MSEVSNYWCQYDDMTEVMRWCITCYVAHDAPDSSNSEIIPLQRSSDTTRWHKQQHKGLLRQSITDWAEHSTQSEVCNPPTIFWQYQKSKMFSFLFSHLTGLILTKRQERSIAENCKMTWISDGDIWPPLFVYCFCFTKLMLKDLNFDKSPFPNLDIPFKQKLKYLGKTGFEKAISITFSSKLTSPRQVSLFLFFSCS